MKSGPPAVVSARQSANADEDIEGRLPAGTSSWRSRPDGSRWSATERLPEILYLLGSGCVLLGGLVAAVTGPLDLDRGSWLAAYLVLVCGAAQCMIGRAQRWLVVRPVAAAPGWAQLGCWNLGSAAVIVGTLVGLPAVVDVGGALLVIGLAIAFHAIRHSAHRLVGWLYRCFLGLLIVSIPVGLALARLRANS